MRLISLVILVLASACTLGDKRYKSNWYVLDHADEADCEKWPKRERDLRIEEIKPAFDLAEKVKGFSVRVLTRSANNAYYFAPFDDDARISMDDLIPIELPRRAVLIGAFFQGKKKYLLTAQNSVQGLALELRGLGDNVIRGKAAIKGESIEDGRMIQTPLGIWMSWLSRDGIYKIALIKIGPKEELITRQIPGTYEAQPTLIPKPKGIFAVWKEESGNSLKYRWIPAQGPSLATQALAFKVEQQIESWAVGADGGQNFLVVVDGDTLIGQAKLVFGIGHSFESSFNISEIYRFLFKNTHATEPVITKEAGKSYALIMNWIDEESTIARYQLSEKISGRPSYAGIFPKGTKIQTTFRGGDDLFLLVKNKHEAQWDFHLCEL